MLCRCAAAVMLLPGLGEAEPPATLRAGLSVALVLLVLPGVGQVVPPDGWRCCGMVLAEILCGATLGWLARCVALALPAAGQVISFMLGLSSIVSPDPLLGQSGAVMRLFSLAAPVLVLGTGLWTLPVAALCNSYDLVPPGHLPDVPDTAAMAAADVGALMGLALRLAAPFVMATVVWYVALGLLNRLIPQLQIYFVALPGQILGGLALLAALSTALADTWLAAARNQFAGLPGL